MTPRSLYIVARDVTSGGKTPDCCVALRIRTQDRERDAASTAGAGAVCSGTGALALRLRRSACASAAAEHQRQHDRLLHVQPVLGLVVDAALRPVGDLGGDLLAAMRGQAVQEDGVALGVPHEGVVDRPA